MSFLVNSTRLIRMKRGRFRPWTVKTRMGEVTFDILQARNTCNEMCSVSE